MHILKIFKKTFKERNGKSQNCEFVTIEYLNKLIYMKLILNLIANEINIGNKIKIKWKLLKYHWKKRKLNVESEILLLNMPGKSIWRHGDEHSKPCFHCWCFPLRSALLNRIDRWFWRSHADSRPQVCWWSSPASSTTRLMTSLMTLISLCLPIWPGHWKVTMVNKC